MIENYTAPDEVYRSAMAMGPNRSKNLQSNLTWELRVDSGFNYLVRLHFCETEPNINFVGERRFEIYIDYQIAEPDADILLWTDENRETPIYKEYVVMIRKKGLDGEKQHILSIDLHPRSDSILQEAILNGIEVFKLSNRDGSLTKPDLELGVNSPVTAVKRTSIAIGIGTGFLVVIFLMGCMVFWKLKKSNRYVSYYPLSRCWCLCWLRLNTYGGKQTGKKTSSLMKEQCHRFSLADIKIATNNFH